MGQGKFITFEGGEGTGKTTQISLLAAWLRKQNIAVETLRSPGGTEVAEKLRKILKEPVPGEDLEPETELLLFGACHVQLIRHRIRPLLEKGVWVLCDRFFDSTVVYQGYARGLELEKVKAVNRFAGGGFEPDLTILLDIDPREGMRRSAVRQDVSSDRFDSETLLFHEKVRHGFLELAKQDPRRFRTVPAAGSIGEITEKITGVIRNEYGLGLL